jgi:hypothetical protein
MTYKPGRAGDDIAAGMNEWLQSLGQYGVAYGGVYEEFKNEMRVAMEQSDKCTALKRLRLWLGARNRAARLEVEGKFGQVMRELADAERRHCGG